MSTFERGIYLSVLPLPLCKVNIQKDIYTINSKYAKSFAYLLLVVQSANARATSWYAQLLYTERVFT